MWILKYNPLRILSCMCLALCLMCITGCKNEDLNPDNQLGEGSIALQLQGNSIARSTTSIITEEEARLFLVTLYKGTDIVNRQTQLSEFVNLTFPVGYGYKVSVENITEQDAEALNDNWGAKRYTGLSKSFGIQAGQTTKVTVGCSVANSAVAVNIADGVENCTVNVISGERILSTAESRTAYFNVPENGLRNVTVQVIKNGEIVSVREFELSPAQVKDINIKPGTQEESTADILVTYDDSFDIIETEVTLTPDEE